MVRRITKSGLGKRIGEYAKVLTNFNGKIGWHEGELIVIKKYPKEYAVLREDRVEVPLVKGATRIGLKVAYCSKLKNRYRKDEYTQYFQFE